MSSSALITCAKVQLKPCKSKFFEEKMSFEPFLISDLIGKLSRNDWQLTTYMMTNADSVKPTLARLVKWLQSLHDKRWNAQFTLWIYSLGYLENCNYIRKMPIDTNRISTRQQKDPLFSGLFYGLVLLPVVLSLGWCRSLSSWLNKLLPRCRLLVQPWGWNLG